MADRADGAQVGDNAGQQAADPNAQGQGNASNGQDATSPADNKSAGGQAVVDPVAAKALEDAQRAVAAAATVRAQFEAEEQRRIAAETAAAEAAKAKAEADAAKARADAEAAIAAATSAANEQLATVRFEASVREAAIRAGAEDIEYVMFKARTAPQDGFDAVKFVEALKKDKPAHFGGQQTQRTVPATTGAGLPSVSTAQPSTADAVMQMSAKDYESLRLRLIGSIT